MPMTRNSETQLTIVCIAENEDCLLNVLLKPNHKFMGLVRKRMLIGTPANSAELKEQYTTSF